MERPKFEVFTEGRTGKPVYINPAAVEYVSFADTTDRAGMTCISMGRYLKYVKESPEEVVRRLEGTPLEQLASVELGED